MYIDLENSVKGIVAFVRWGKDEKINILRRLEKGLLAEIETIFYCISQLPPEYMPTVHAPKFLSFYWSGE